MQALPSVPAKSSWYQTRDDMSKLAALRWTDRWVNIPSSNSTSAMKHILLLLDEHDQGKLCGKELVRDEMVEATSQMDISLT